LLLLAISLLHTANAFTAVTAILLLRGIHGYSAVEVINGFEIDFSGGNR